MSALADAKAPHNRSLDKLVAQLINEDSTHDHKRRSVHRTPFVRPVVVRIRGSEQRRIAAFSKNISPLGIGLIVEETIPENTVATLCIHSLKNKKVQIRSELRWSQPFGNGWSLTGWSFIAENHSFFE